MKLRKAWFLDSSCKNQAWWCVPTTLGLEERNRKFAGGWWPSSITISVSSRFTERPFPKNKVVIEEDICLLLLTSTLVYMKCSCTQVPCLHTRALSTYNKRIKSISQHSSIMKSKHMGSCPVLGYSTALGSMLAQFHIHTLCWTGNHYSVPLGSGHLPSHSLP